MPSILLPKGTDAAKSAPFTLAEGEVARLVMTGGQIDKPGFVLVLIKVDANEWSVVTRLEGPTWRALDLTGPGEFILSRPGDASFKSEIGVNRI